MDADVVRYEVVRLGDRQIVHLLHPYRFDGDDLVPENLAGGEALQLFIPEGCGELEEALSRKRPSAGVDVRMVFQPCPATELAPRGVAFTFRKSAPDLDGDQVAIGLVVS